MPRARPADAKPRAARGKAALAPDAVDGTTDAADLAAAAPPATSKQPARASPKSVKAAQPATPKASAKAGAQSKPTKPARKPRAAQPASANTDTEAKKPARRGRPHYHVYVIELSPDVLNEPRFLRSNPGYITGKPCVYVGMTGLDPDVRFDKHKAGIQHNRYVLRYGQRLLPDLYEGFNPLRYDEAVAREVEIGIDLRSAGWGVWQA